MWRDQLRSLSFYHFGVFDGIPVVVYDDDRWTLPVLLEAQRHQILRGSSRLLSLDYHFDAITPRRGLGAARTLRTNGIPWSEFVQFVDGDLSKSDDDWIVAGMELGLLQDVVVFGAQEGTRESTPALVDGAGVAHTLLRSCSIPGPTLGHQGELSDLADRRRYGLLWNTLGWEHTPDVGFRFTGEPRINVFHIDLDCFTIPWESYVFPWPSEVFRDKLLGESNCAHTRGWTGKRFLREIIDRAQLILIAREPNCTGGHAHSNRLLRLVNRFVFDGRIELERDGRNR